MKYQADLHIHSCLSPCGSLEMSPAAIVRQARRVGLDLVALTDHNSALNTPAFAEACRREGLKAFFGLEATSLEEAHMLCLFDTPDQAIVFANHIASTLPPLPNKPERYGDQVYVDADDNILGEVENYLLAGGCAYDATTLRGMVEDAGGLFIPAHVDRPAFSFTSQLGFVPDEPWTALETTRMPCPVDTHRRTLICDSDAHYLDDVGRRRFRVELPEVSIEALAEALRAGRVEPLGV